MNSTIPPAGYEGWLTAEQAADITHTSRNDISRTSRRRKWRVVKANRRAFYHPDDVNNPHGNVITIDRPTPNVHLARRVTDLRLAVEIASHAIRIGRYDEALTALNNVK